MRRNTLQWFSQTVYLDHPVEPLVGDAGFLEAERRAAILGAWTYCDQGPYEIERYIMRGVRCNVGMAWQVWGANGTYAMGNTFLPRLRKTISLPCLEATP